MFFLPFDDGELVEVEAFVAGGFLHSITSLTLNLRLLMTSWSIVIGLRSESAILFLFLFELFLGLLDPLLLIGRSCEDIEDCDLLTIVSISDTLTVFLSILLSGIADLRLEGAVFLLFALDLLRFGLLTQTDVPDTVEVEQFEVLGDLGTVGIEVTIFGFSEFLGTLGLHSISDLDSFHCDEERSDHLLVEATVLLATEGAPHR